MIERGPRALPEKNREGGQYCDPASNVYYSAASGGYLVPDGRGGSRVASTPDGFNGLLTADRVDPETAVSPASEESRLNDALVRDFAFFDIEYIGPEGPRYMIAREEDKEGDMLLSPSRFGLLRTVARYRGFMAPYGHIRKENNFLNRRSLEAATSRLNTDMKVLQLEIGLNQGRGSRLSLDSAGDSGRGKFFVEKTMREIAHDTSHPMAPVIEERTYGEDQQMMIDGTMVWMLADSGVDISAYVQLAPKNIDLLSILAGANGRPVPSNQLKEELGAAGSGVAQAVHRLREELRSADAPMSVETVFNQGYKLILDAP